MAWITEESLPTASWQLAAAVCQAPASESGEWVYAIGGNGEGGVLAAVAGYDTVQQRWFARPSMPTPRAGHAAATSPGRVHVLGGFSGIADALTTHEVYEPANDAWSKAAPLPTMRGTVAAATGPDGLIYAIGGSDANSSTLATVEAYTSDKCYPIEHKIAVVENEINIAVSNLGDLPHRAEPAPRSSSPA